MKRLNKEYGKNRRGYYKFLCTCGQTTILRGDSTATSCQQSGCTVNTLRKHGKANTRLYTIWSGMRDRCFGTHRSTKHYKEVGRSICTAWNEFIVFEEWALSSGYAETLTIDRIDIDGNYSPDNCEWVTRSENTKRQHKDRHPTAKKVQLIATNGISKNFLSIISAAQYIEPLTTVKASSIRATLERRIKTNSNKPYKGFVILKQ